VFCALICILFVDPDWQMYLELDVPGCMTKKRQKQLKRRKNR